MFLAGGENRPLTTRGSCARKPSMFITNERTATTVLTFPQRCGYLAAIMSRTKRKLTSAERMRVAIKAPCSLRTVDAYLEGEREHHPTIRASIERALRALGLSAFIRPETQQSKTG